MPQEQTVAGTGYIDMSSATYVSCDLLLAARWMAHPVQP